MSFSARIADQTVTIHQGDTPDFGVISDGRRVSFTGVTSLATKALRLAFISTLNTRLQMGCDLVMLPTSATYSQALKLLPGGSAIAIHNDAFELGGSTFYRVEADCEPYATPANRVFLASPIGDEFPSSDDVVRLNTDDYKSYLCRAVGGRYRIAADGTNVSGLQLWGDCSASETLYVEFKYYINSLSGSGGLFVSFTSSDGASATYARTLLSTTTAGTYGHYRGYMRTHATANTFYIFATNLGGGDATSAYIWDVHVGEKASATERVVPTSPSSTETSTTPPGWSKSGTITDVAYSLSDHAGYFGIVGSGDGANAEAYWTGPLFAVRPTERIGWTGYIDVDSVSAGSAQLRLYYYSDAAGATYLSNVTLQTVSSATAATYYGEQTVPSGAASARLRFYIPSAAIIDAHGNAFDAGQHILEAPAHVSLAAMSTELPAPLEIWGDVDVESDCHALWYGIAKRGAASGAYTFEAEAQTWTGTGDAYSTTAALYPGTGNTGWVNSATNDATASLSVTLIPPGTYELLVRGMTNNASYTATFGCTTTGSTVTTVETTPQWLSLGLIHLPATRTWPGTANTVAVSLDNVASGATTADRYVFVPVAIEGMDHGGYLRVHPSAAATDYDSIDVDERGIVYLDGSVNMSGIIARRIYADSRDELMVVAEEAASDETTHLCLLDIVYRPRYALWR